LCDHADQWTFLAEHPDLAPNAVEEVMRYYPIIFNTLRQAIDDVALAGVTIPAGTLIIANTAAANRDPGVFDEPDRLDITRDGPAAMLTFGGGIHYCLGAHLARIELTEALRVITARMPNPRRTGPAPWKPITGICGPTTPHRRDLQYEESVGVEAIPLVLLAEWTYSNCAVFLDRNPTRVSSGRRTRDQYSDILTFSRPESDLKMRCHEKPP
jgi:hypothetical protein